MSGRFLVVLALAAGIGTAAAAQDTTPFHFKPGAAGRSAGVIPQRGGRTDPTQSDNAEDLAAQSRQGSNVCIVPSARTGTENGVRP